MELTTANLSGLKAVLRTFSEFTDKFRLQYHLYFKHYNESVRMLKDVKKSMTSFERRLRLQEVLARAKLEHLMKIPLIAMFA